MADRAEMRMQHAGEREQEEAAAAEAARIGGEGADAGVDPALRPVYEAGGGEAEGFEGAEEALIEHASHGDQQSAHAVLHDAGRESEETTAAAGLYGEADHEHSSEIDEDLDYMELADEDDLEDWERE